MASHQHQATVECWRRETKRKKNHIQMEILRPFTMRSSENLLQITRHVCAYDESSPARTTTSQKQLDDDDFDAFI